MYFAALIVIFLGGVVRPAFAEYGAIAYDDQSCGWGRSWNFPDQAGADQRALSECATNGSKCKVVAHMGPGECGAVAAILSCGGYGWSVRPRISEAQLVALKQCQKYNPKEDCKVMTSLCSSR